MLGYDKRDTADAKCYDRANPNPKARARPNTLIPTEPAPPVLVAVADAEVEVAQLRKLQLLELVLLIETEALETVTKTLEVCDGITGTDVVAMAELLWLSVAEEASELVEEHPSRIKQSQRPQTSIMAGTISLSEVCKAIPAAREWRDEESRPGPYPVW